MLQYGVKYIRGCELLGMYDEADNLIRDYDTNFSARAGNIRKLRVKLDAIQYTQDMNNKEEDIYGTFNLIVRRRPEANNFRGVLGKKFVVWM